MSGWVAVSPVSSGASMWVSRSGRHVECPTLARRKDRFGLTWGRQLFATVCSASLRPGTEEANGKAVDLSSSKGCREPMPQKDRLILTPHVMGRFA